MIYNIFFSLTFSTFVMDLIPIFFCFSLYSDFWFAEIMHAIEVCMHAFQLFNTIQHGYII